MQLQRHAALLVQNAVDARAHQHAFLGRLQMDVGGALLLALLQDVVDDERDIGGERLVEKQILLLPGYVDRNEAFIAAFGRLDAGFEIGQRFEEGGRQHGHRLHILSGARFQPVANQHVARIERRIFQRVRILALRRLQQQDTALLRGFGVQPIHIGNRFQELAPRADEARSDAFRERRIEVFIGGESRIQRHGVEQRMTMIARAQRERDGFALRQYAARDEIACDGTEESTPRALGALARFRGARAAGQRRGLVRSGVGGFLRGCCLRGGRRRSKRCRSRVPTGPDNDSRIIRCRG